MKASLAIGIFLFCYHRGTLHGQVVGNLQISSNRAVHFIVTDPQGRKTGVDPRGAENPLVGKRLNEIPKANYSTNAIGDSPQKYEPLETDIQHEFLYNVESPANDGTYQIECIGLMLARFELSVSLLVDNLGQTSSLDTSLAGLVDVNSVVAFRMQYNGQEGGITRIERLVSSSNIRQDLDNSYKLKLLGDKGFHKELSNILDNYEKHLSKKDTLKALKELGKFQDRITEEYKEGTKSRDKRFVTIDALQILSYDVKYLIDQLHNKSNRGREDDKDKKPKT